MRGLRVGVAGFVAVVIALAAAPAGAATPPGRALVLGDSLTMESAGHLWAQVVKHRGWTATVHAYGGSAPCDWVGWLPADLAEVRPTVVGIETVGNWYPSACMAGIAPGSAAYWAKYRADLSTLIVMAKGAGARVVLVYPPPMLDPTRQAISQQMVVEMKALAVQHHVSVSGRGRSALGGSKYTSHKACLGTETPAMGCDGGRIPVRTLPPAGDVGLHLCPSGLLDVAEVGVCPTYSSGELRFGRAVGASVVANLPTL